MIVVLPCISFIVLFLLLLSEEIQGTSESLGWRGAFLKACILWGAFIALSSEILGILHALTFVAVTILWGLYLVVLFYLGWRSRSFHQAWGWVKGKLHQQIDVIDVLLVGLLASVILFLLSIAWKAIPSNTDSLLYHMSRVMHWMQNQDLAHYSTQYDQQLWLPPLAEYIFLHLRILAGNDQIVNIVQWFSMVASLIGVTLVSKLLGAGKREQMLAGFFVLSIPIGILQSTSTQNDYVVTLWLVCTATFVVLNTKNELKLKDSIFLMIAVGLGILTKPVYYLYATPFLIWYFIPKLNIRRIGKFLKEGLALTGVVLLLNVGFWTRNLITYGLLLGHAESYGRWLDFGSDPRLWLTSILKHSSLNFVSTIPKSNDFLIAFVRRIHEIMHVDLGEFILIPGWNHEDLAGNPLHALLVFFTLIILVVLFHRDRIKLTTKYAVSVLGGFILFSIIMVYYPYYIRFHLPFFVLWGSVFAVAMTQIQLGKWTRLVAIMLVISSIPWLLLNSTRSAIAKRPYTRMGGSIFLETTEAILFVNWHNLRQPYTDAAQVIRDLECTDVGLMIDSHDIEYPFWRLLDAPESGIRIEAVGNYPNLERYKDPTFSPCVVICSLCGDKEEILGLNRYLDLGEGFALFVQSEYKNKE